MRLLINILISFKHFHFLLLIFSSLSICSSTSTSSSSSFFLISLISLSFSFILFVSSLFRFPGGNRVYIIFWLTFEAKSKYFRDGTNYSQLLTPFFPRKSSPPQIYLWLYIRVSLAKMWSFLYSISFTCTCLSVCQIAGQLVYWLVG